MNAKVRDDAEPGIGDDGYVEPTWAQPEFPDQSIEARKRNDPPSEEDDSVD